MKKITLLLATTAFFLHLHSQTSNQPGCYPFPKTISVTGSAAMEVIPDEIYVQVDLREYKKKGEDKSEDKKDEKGGKVDKHKAFIEMLKKKKENKSINEWVEDAVQKHYHPFTTKNDIMEMINSRIGGSVDIEEEETMVEPAKLPGFMTAKAIRGVRNGGAAPAPAQPKTRPDTKPGQPKVDPNKRPRRTPYEPGPGVNPHPKAKALDENEPVTKPNVPVIKPGEVKKPRTSPYDPVPGEKTKPKA